MRTIAGHVVVVIVLLAGGEVFRRTATFEDALSSAEERLTTENPADTLPREDDERAVPLGASLPVVGSSIKADLRRQRALAAYWRADYQALKAPEPEGEPADGDTRFVAANAMFRDLARQPMTSQALVRGLDVVLKAYVSVLEVDPNAVDAAYNYEFVSRVRGILAAGRASSIQLQSEPKLEGDKGAPPKETNSKEFNIIVPLSPDERQEQVDPGGGAVLQRKG